jgi:hypothetical protein
VVHMQTPTEPTADQRADSALEQEVAGLYVVINAKEMRMVVAGLNLGTAGVDAQQLNLKHAQEMYFHLALMKLKTMASLEQGREGNWTVEIQERTLEVADLDFDLNYLEGVAVVVVEEVEVVDLNLN